ncbi:hypothetical protein CMV_027811, partial [Castanea mollissima]
THLQSTSHHCNTADTTSVKGENMLKKLMVVIAMECK